MKTKPTNNPFLKFPIKIGIHYYATLIFFIVAFAADTMNHKWEGNHVFHYDSFGYHNYLPALIIYKDISNYKFLDSIEHKYKPTGDTCYKYGLNEVEKTKKLCNQYPIGVALFQLPFFVATHAWAKLTQRETPNGYSKPYQQATVYSTLLFATLSLLILTSFLVDYFPPKAVFFTILIISLGTNFFQYATLESGLSHIYLFFLYSAILKLTQLWYRKATLLHSILMGICIGLCIITRPIDILVCLIPIFWLGMGKEKITYLKSNWKKILVIIGFAFLFTLPQLIYWKYVTGDWLYYSYSKVDYFQFDRFRIIHGLFSYRKGWFLYTPIAFFAFFQISRIAKHPKLFFYKNVFWIFFIPMIYLVFSWHNWFYGWSFGCKALVQTLPLLAIPIANSIQELSNASNIKKSMMALMLAFFVFLNLFQTWQYNKGIIHGTLMNEAIYWKVFLSTDKDASLDKNFKLQNEIDWNTGER